MLLTSQKLKLMARYLEKRPELDQRLSAAYESPHFHLWAEDIDDFKRLIKQLGGYEKSGSNGALRAEHISRSRTDRSDRYYSLSVTLYGHCESKPKIDENGLPIMRPVRKWVETGEFEQEQEWDCPTVWSDNG